MKQITIDGINYVCEVGKVVVHQEIYWPDLLPACFVLIIIIIIIIAIRKSNKTEREFFEKFMRNRK